MFDLFKNRPRDVKEIRSAILQFIKEQLQKVEGGEGSNIRAIYLFVNCTEADRHLYESAVYVDTPDRFKNDEVQKIADDYAISLPTEWNLVISFDEQAPPEALHADGMNVSMVIATFKNTVLNKQATAYINILSGEAEKKQYLINATQSRINIGRASGVQTADGFFRKNNIAFLDSEQNAENRAISRQHAHIEWNGESGSFFLYADEGGIPPFNKVKVRSAGGVPIKLLSSEIGHRLHDGDQVILGDSALLEFTFSAE